MPAQDIVVQLADAETITALERRNVVVLAEREDITITWTRYAAGEPGPDLHVHREHVDAFYVLDGELTFPVGPGAERVRVPAGGFVAVPPNVVHTFVNDSGAEARWLNFHAPDKGFAAYLRAMRDGTGGSFDSFDPPADGGRPATEVIVTGPGEGERLETGRLVKGVLPDLSVVEWTLDGPEPHRHADSYYVLEGELELTVDGSVHAAGPDTLASIPRGVSHTLAGTGRVLGLRARGSLVT